jgi:hypothetical protein
VSRDFGRGCLIETPFSGDSQGGIDDFPSGLGGWGPGPFTSFWGDFHLFTHDLVSRGGPERTFMSEYSLNYILSPSLRFVKEECALDVAAQ